MSQIGGVRGPGFGSDPAEPGPKCQAAGFQVEKRSCADHEKSALRINEMM